MADRDGAYGLIQLYKAAAKCGVKPVLGLALTDGAGDFIGTGHGPPGSAGFNPRTVGRPAASANDGGADLRARHSSESRQDASAPNEIADRAVRATEDNGGQQDTGEECRLQTGAPREIAGAEPAAWVYAQDRDGYSELCLLAALRQGCWDDGQGDAGGAGVPPAILEEKVGGTGAAGTGLNGGHRGPPHQSHWDLIRALLSHTHHCYVVSSRAGVLSALAPRLGPGRVFVRLDADYGGAGRSRQIEQLKLAARFGLRPVACTDARFLRPQDQAVHHVLRAIGQNATLYTAQGVRPREHYLSAPTELAGYYYNCPESLANARALAQRCNVDFELGRWVFPRYELRGGTEPRVALYQLCQRGLGWRGVRDPDGRYSARLEMELRVIEELGYTSYFLAVYDIVREAKRRRIPHVGRGSAANSLVSYLLGLTPVDPLRYDMYFERFLNPQRTSPPDIDIDFNWKRRDEILGYVYERWGAERVAMISTHVTFRARSALREVAKVFGLGDAEISTVSKFLPHISAAGLPSAQREFPELRGIDFTAEPYCHVLPLASRLDGKPRHLGIHCGGVVIAPTRITDYTGLQRAAKGFVVTQYDMFPVEDVGLIKIDLLGNRSLGVLEDTLAVLERADASGAGAPPAAPTGTGGPRAADCAGPRAKGQGPGEGTGKREQGTVGRASRPAGSAAFQAALKNAGCKPALPGRMPAPREITDRAVRATGSAGFNPREACGQGRPPSRDNIRRVISDWETLSTDPATVALIREGLTMGCFYIESPGMRQLLRRLRTQTFLDLTAASSVIRPGVAESGMMQEYIRRVRGEAPRAPTHPLLQQVMPETHGVMIYQEDVIKVAHRVAGMSLADADLLRRAMSGKMRSQQAMNQIRERFIAGCEHNGVDLAGALEIWRQIASFAGYSFCKAHSASFATLSFQVAWLKAHHPAVFMAAVLSNGGGFYGPRAYLSECERLGLRILPPDANHSRMEFTAEVGRTAVSAVRADRRVGQTSGSGGILPPSDGRLEAAPTKPDAVRVGLSLIKGVSAALLERIVHEREHGGLYRSLPNFIRRTRPGERDLGVLIRVGALDSLGMTRPELLWLAQMERKAALRTGDMTRPVGRTAVSANLKGTGNREQGTEKSGTGDPRAADKSGRGGFQPPIRRRQDAAATGCLADTAVGPTGGHGGPPHHGSSQPLPFDERERIDDFRARVGATLDDYDELRLCELELEHLGLLVRRHPLTLYQHLVSGVVSARDLPRHAGKWVRLLGWCIATKRVDLTRRQAVRDTLELLAEHADMPEPSETDGSFEEEREGAAEDLGIVLRNPRGTGGPRAADRSTENNGGRGDPPHQFQGTGGVSPPTDQRRDAAATPEEFAPSRRAMKFMSMEDLTGTFEVTLFAEAYARFAALTRHAGPFLVTGRVEEQFDTYTVNATELRLLRLDDDGSALAPPSPARSQSIRSAGRAKGGG